MKTGNPYVDLRGITRSHLMVKFVHSSMMKQGYSSQWAVDIFMWNYINRDEVIRKRSIGSSWRLFVVHAHQGTRQRTWMGVEPITESTIYVGQHTGITPHTRNYTGRSLAVSETGAILVRNDVRVGSGIPMPS